MNDEKTASGGDFVRDLGEAIRENPLPAALIGVGLAWLFTGGGSSANAGFRWARDGMARFRPKEEGETARGPGRSFNAAVTSAGEKPERRERRRAATLGHCFSAWRSNTAGLC